MLTKEQLASRKKGVGGSDAPSVVGVDSYRQPLDVWLEKTGQVEPENLDDKEVVRWGNLLEDLVAQEWAKRQNKHVRRRNATIINPKFPHMLAHIDRKVVGMRAGLEVKTRGTFAAEDYGPSGTDQVKPSDIIQCHHYMAVTEYPIWHMAVLIGGQDMRCYDIHRDQTLVDSLIDIEFEFWQKVKRMEQPDLLFEHRSTDDLIRKLYPGTNGQQIQLPNEAVELHERRSKLNAAIKEAEKEAEIIQRQLKDMMGEAAVGFLSDGSGGYGRKLVKRKGYKVEPTEYWGFRFGKKHKQQ